MSWFNRDRLVAALEAGKISADEKTISHLDNFLHVMRFVYRINFASVPPPPGYVLIGIIKCRGPSKELKRLNEALQEWIDADFEAKQMEEDVLSSYNHLCSGSSTMMIKYFSEVLSNTVGWLESTAMNSKEKQALETCLFIDIYRKYVELSENKKFSDSLGGLFVKECTSILGVAAPDGVRRRIQQAIARSHTKPPQPPPNFSSVMALLRIYYPEWNNYASFTTSSPDTVKPLEAG
jgi:hypothetical protein